MHSLCWAKHNLFAMWTPWSQSRSSPCKTNVGDECYVRGGPQIQRAWCHVEVRRCLGCFLKQASVLMCDLLLKTLAYANNPQIHGRLIVYIPTGRLVRSPRNVGVMHSSKCALLYYIAWICSVYWKTLNIVEILKKTWKFFGNTLKILEILETPMNNWKFFRNTLEILEILETPRKNWKFFRNTFKILEILETPMKNWKFFKNTFNILEILEIPRKTGNYFG